MIITVETRAELLASGWAEPVTDPVRLDALAHTARNAGADLVAALPSGETYVIDPSDRNPIPFWGAVHHPQREGVLSGDLVDWAAEQDGPVRCWTT